MSRRLRWLLIAVIALVATAMIGVLVRAARQTDTDQDHDERPPAPAVASAQNAPALVTLDTTTQAREGIRVELISATSMRAELRGTAVILAAGDLAAARNSYFAAAHTNLERDQANVGVAQSQYERVKKLYEQDQNMSLKAMQDAEAAYRSSQAQLATDQQDARLELDVVRQRWGPVVTRWIESNAQELDAIFDQKDFLAQVTFPPGEIATAPAAMSLSLPDGKFVQAKLVSALPQVNPQIQSVSFLYLVPASPELAAGMNLDTEIPVGRLLHGIVVPDSAIVWWQGAAWTYVQTSSNQFSRHAVATNLPVSGGFFLPGDALGPAPRLVTVGGSTLLSQELLVHSQSEGDSDEDD